MPIGKLLGVRKVSFTAQDGGVVSGHNIFVSQAINPEFGRGESVEKVFVSDAHHLDFDSFSIGDRVLLDFNSRGKFGALTKLK